MSHFGASLLFFGIASFVLPHFGFQYNFMQAVGLEMQPYVSGGLVVVGLLAAIGGGAVEGGSNYE